MSDSGDEKVPSHDVQNIWKRNNLFRIFEPKILRVYNESICTEKNTEKITFSI